MIIIFCWWRKDRIWDIFYGFCGYLLFFELIFFINNEYYYVWKIFYESKLILKFYFSNIKLLVYSDNEFMKNLWILWY